MIAWTAPKTDKPKTMMADRFSNEKTTITINVTTVDRVAGIPSLEKIYPDFPSGVIEKYLETLSSISSKVIMAKAKQRSTGAMIERNKSNIG
nr:hypothetical protein [uncultured Blautia sp.]